MEEMQSEISQINKYHISPEHLLFIVCIFLLLPSIGSQTIRLLYKDTLYTEGVKREDGFFYVYSAWLAEDQIRKLVEQCQIEGGVEITKDNLSVFMRNALHNFAWIKSACIATGVGALLGQMAEFALCEQSQARNLDWHKDVGVLKSLAKLLISATVYIFIMVVFNF